MLAKRQTAFTLIELIVFIVIVSVALAGVLAVYNVAVKGSADPIREKQAIAVAEAMLEEILTKPFCDPDTVVLATEGSSTPSVCGVHTNEVSGGDRHLADDVDDYSGYSSNTIIDASTNSTVLPGYSMNVIVCGAAGGTCALGGAFSAGVAGNSIAITDYRIVTVTVTDGSTHRSYSLTGYKFNND